jgi:cobalamin biosynthesis Mg chelatase CobN
MAEDWLSDVRKYAPGAEPDDVAGIVRYCGIALRKRDSSLVSFSSPEEIARVRENFLKKKLALDHGDSTLDDAIASVGERMKADRTKNRVTVYYLLAEHFDKLPAFRKAASGTKKSSPSASATSASAASIPSNEAEPAPATSAAPASPTSASASQSERFTGTTAESARPAGESSSFNWWWIAVALIVIVILFAFFR